MKSILLVGNRDRSSQFEVLRENLQKMDLIIVASEEEAVLKISHQPYDLVIVDASEGKAPAQLVYRLRTMRPGTRIIVRTNTPTWQEARDVLRAGATDYIRKSFNERELYSQSRTVLKSITSFG